MPLTEEKRKRGETISDRSAARKQGVVALRQESEDEIVLRLAVADAIFWRKEATRLSMLCAALQARLPHVDMHALEKEFEQILKAEAA
jgi:hypothetical protein